MIDLTPYLDDIERRIDVEEETAIYNAWKNFAFGLNPEGDVFEAPHRTARESSVEWKHVHINDAIEDEELMILSQLERCHKALSENGNTLMMMRPNYGVGIVASMFGAKPFIMPREAHMAPNVYALESGTDDVQRIVDGPALKLTEGFVSHVFSVGEKFARIREKYPKIREFVRFENPDTQGPIDNCELLWGSENMFFALYDEPELMHKFLNRITETIEQFVKKWFTYISYEDGCTTFFGHLLRGNIVIRNDSAMNLSADVFKEFIQPYDTQLLQSLGSGGIHFCGTGDHFVDLLAKTPALTHVDMSQPHLNDMNKVLSAIPDQGINLSCPYGDYSVEGHVKHRMIQCPYRIY